MCGLSAKPILDKSHESKIQYRGPDSTYVVNEDSYCFTFHRLAIMDTSSLGDQPFVNEQWVVMCNGEIYNYTQIKQNNTYPYKSNSDCEVLLPLLNNYSLHELCNILDGEFAFVGYNRQNKTIIAARDPMGIRPLFYGYSENNQICFASEMKELLICCKQVFPFPPGFYFDGKQFFPYLQLYAINGSKHNNLAEVLPTIKNLLIKATKKRLHADVPVAFLLSGGLDSSLVCSIAAKHLNKQIETFAIGLDVNPIDLKYAKQVAQYLNSKHHEVIITNADVLDALKQVIWLTETWDITTIRASIPMYLLCKYIRQNSTAKVILTGEISDELFGYKYTDFAPNAQEFQVESQKRIKELYMYDVLRADRCISSNGLEARVPFSDKEFIEYVMNIAPELKMNKYNMGKYLLRKAFDNNEYLPQEILWRDKAAFSDAVGHGMVDCLIAAADKMYSDDQYQQKIKAYPQNTPPSKEALMYKEIFIQLFGNQEHVISSYWLPNQSWPNCQIRDPSARHLPNYGASGN
ncbi:MAG: asparagine synthase B [Burkholderiales bacterium]|nr:asparagine synthase B [Burkholderiales bacterium]